MTRIIAGRAGGIRLDVPSAGTRPTSDRVRESLFGALEAGGELDDAAVLDLYAGSGALGLEALSRGARSADLVERAAGAAQVARGNAARVAAACTGASARVHRAAVAAFLAVARGPYDLVFADPPYAVGDDETAAMLAALVPHLGPDALVVLERGARAGAPAATPGLEQERTKRYGDTVLWWLRATGTP
ncbi:16S rRNA (guanine(966)-N(2))-methyltransferase RsmD [Microbacterium elymi]|uniref:16S rRNA (Guanine(966)-N(2))-methyltransferase RsmD n=1 Tax=Microbacterium elymi TaxID=2909587 RepID=A0ABY5NJV1_9MICO|nr:16S rRNA (guanine(966)-N(2))-methyltransferase RsmD [Microbacterium elymi]UUT35451.1 16S rRNA (guanine(966)-N(2))-methyltransferase RsmD [Microbacterium elymi]